LCRCTVSHPNNTEKYIYFFLGALAPKRRRKAVPHRHILTRHELLSPILSFSHLVRGGSRTGQQLLLAPPDEWRERSPVSGRQGIASRTHRKKNVFKSACRVEMLLAAVQVWTREWDDDPLLLNCSVASGSPRRTAARSPF
jgi:hypothetical protein